MKRNERFFHDMGGIVYPPFTQKIARYNIPLKLTCNHADIDISNVIMEVL